RGLASGAGLGRSAIAFSAGSWDCRAFLSYTLQADKEDRMPTGRATRRLPSLALGMLLAIAFARGVEAADSLKLAAGQKGKWDGAVAALGQLAGIFTRHGIELEILWTSGGGETMQAVISGSVDIGMNAGIQGVFGAFAKGAPVRIIGAQATGDDAYWYVRADSAVR